MDLVQKIRIQNFKSIVDTEFELGRVNVFIGPNGGGKSNVFEAVAFASAASGIRLSNDYLASRGVRTGKLVDILSALTRSKKRAIELSISTQKGEINYSITADDSPYPKWIELRELKATNLITAFVEGRMTTNEEIRYIKEFGPPFQDALYLLKTINNPSSKADKTEMETILPSLELWRSIFSEASSVIEKGFQNEPKSNFVIYNPNIQVLRNGTSDVDVSPVDYNGNGLLKLVSTIKGDDLELLNNALSVIDWFASFKTVEKNPMDFELVIQDRFSAKKAFKLNQWSANEGFLYILFYHTVILSQYTPKFFAIENIETALNPRLAAETMRQVVHLTKQKDKQLLISTHSPDVLDGLDLTDDEQRLFVVDRNIDGHTFVKRKMPKLELLRDYPLSELYRNGSLGGLQDTF